MVTMRAGTLLAALLLVGIPAAGALDFKVTSYECDQDLYVTADFSIKCGEEERCTFGSSTATLAGTLNYKSVANTGMVDNIGYLTADLELVTLQYQFFDQTPIPLCSDSLTAGDGVECPGDGSYAFSVDYNLPSAGSESQSWLASGWNGKGTIQIFAEANANMLIGECTFALDTMVTPADEPNFYRRTVNPPSAAATVGIVLGTLAMVALLCLWCYCCKRKQPRSTTSNASAASSRPDDVSAFFKRMDDETGSVPSTSTSKLTKSSQERKKLGNNFFSSWQTLGAKKPEEEAMV